MLKYLSLRFSEIDFKKSDGFLSKKALDRPMLYSVQCT